MMLKGVLTTMVERMDDASLINLGVIPWSSPVLSFGDITCSHVATLGINPSNREFVSLDGNELDGRGRRFHTLRSLGLKRWSDAGVEHLQLILEYCYTYFRRNPYDTWFKKLDRIMAKAQVSYYNSPLKACHLDLIPYATSCKWTELNQTQRNGLLRDAGSTLGRMIADSSIRVLILNGNSVVQNFERVANISLERRAMSLWALPRTKNEQVAGVAYKGVINEIGGIELRHGLLVLGFNHNIQSSFGVTTKVMNAIQRWISQETTEAFS